MFPVFAAGRQYEFSVPPADHTDADEYRLTKSVIRKAATPPPPFTIDSEPFPTALQLSPPANAGNPHRTLADAATRHADPQAPSIRGTLLPKTN